MLLQFAPYLGYFASLMLIFALLTKSDLNFRYFGMAGNIFFIAYALIVKAYPVLLTNGILLAINGYYCYILLNLKEDFELMEFSGKEKLIQKFSSFYKADEREKEFLRTHGVKYLHYTQMENKKHIQFLKKMNFSKTEDGFIKNLQQNETA